MTDPQDVHGGECDACFNWFADRDDDLNANNICEECAAHRAADALEDARDVYECADAALRQAKADTDHLDIFKQMAVLVPLYTGLLAAHAEYERARVVAYDAKADLPARDWLAVAAGIVGAAR